jgi:CRP-like cAMP-binding protein
MSFLSNLEKIGVTIPQEYLQPTEFMRGSCIIRQDEFGDGCYIIDEGTIRVELVDRKTGKNIVLGSLEAGGVLGEFSFLDDKPRSASAYADNHVKARWFSLQNFKKMCEDDPSIALSITLFLGQDLADKMRNLNQRIHDYIFTHESDPRVLKVLSHTSVPQESIKATRDRADTAVRLYGWGVFSGL